MTSIATLEKLISEISKRVDILEAAALPAKPKTKRTESEYTKFLKVEYEKLKNSPDFSSYKGKDRFMAISKQCSVKWKEMNIK
jgi:hypothetical protein